MSNIGTVHAAILTRLQSLFAAPFQRQTNPYAIELNSEPILNKSYGIAMGPATNSHRQIECTLSVLRLVTVTLTRKAYANELDVVSKSTAELALLDDQLTMIKSFEKDPTINATSFVVSFMYESDSGVQNVFDKKDSFLKVETRFRLEYLEAL